MGQIARIILIGLCLAFSSLTSAQDKMPEADALFNQGKIYHDGLGTAQDFKKARALYERAAAIGSTNAQVNLGYIYFVGEGVPRDFTAARAWYEKAALSGDKSAAQNLAYMDSEKLGLASKAVAPKTMSTAFTKPTPTALPTAPKPVAAQTLKPAHIRDYGTLLERSAPEIISAQLTTKTVANTTPSYSSVTVFGMITLIAIVLGGMVGWMADRRAAKKRREVHELARQFFENNRRLLREIYIRYPSEMRDMGKREAGWAVAISVLIVRFVIFKNNYADDDAPTLPKTLSSQILGHLKTCPAKARHTAFTLIPDLVELIKSDIRAFDIEHVTAPEAPILYKSPRKNPRKIVWEPRLVASH